MNRHHYLHKHEERGGIPSMDNPKRFAYADPQMTLSLELQMGKAAEHLVCADLIIQGYSAFLADQGLPYDVVVDTPQGLKRVQVKACLKATTNLSQRRYDVYTFYLRRAKKGARKLDSSLFDYIAFVALDRRAVAYLPSHVLLGRNGKDVMQIIQFRGDSKSLPIQAFPKGALRAMRFMDEYSCFPLEVAI